LDRIAQRRASKLSTFHVSEIEERYSGFEESEKLIKNLLENPDKRRPSERPSC
jgi:hypothetical protein